MVIRKLGEVPRLLHELAVRTIDEGAGVGNLTGWGVGPGAGGVIGCTGATVGVGPSGHTTKSFSSTLHPGGMLGGSITSPSNGGRVNSGVPPSHIA